MSKLSLLLLLISLGMGAVIYQDRQKIAELENAHAASNREAIELQEAGKRAQEKIARLSTDVETFKTESEQLRAQLTPAAAGSVASGAKDASDTAAGEKKPSAPGKEWMKSMSRMFNDPEMRKSMRVQQMVGIRMIYGDLAKQLGLAGDDAEQLLEMLGDRQMDLAATAMTSGGGQAIISEEAAKKSGETQKRYAEQLEAVLGKERYAEFQKYERSIGDRFMLQQFEGQFAAVGAPLEAGQKERLLGLMAEERVKTPNRLGNTANPKEQMDALGSETETANYVTSQEAFNRRILERSRDILSPDQVAALEKVQQQQLEMMKAQMKMSREFLGLGK